METDADLTPSWPGQQPDRGLDAVQLRSNRIKQQLSVGTSMAADNLLAKAVVRLETGDEPRARALVARALRLPYDDHEEVYPAPHSAHMLLFTMISNDLEDSEVGHPGWLDRAQTLIDTCGPVAAAEVRVCLRNLLGDYYQMSAPEARRVKSLTRGLEQDVEALAGVPLEQEARIPAVLDVLKATIEYRRLLSSS